MTRTPDTPNEGESTEKKNLSPDDMYEVMDPLEPYATTELATLLDVPKRLARTLLETLAGKDEIRMKEPEPDRMIWIREPPAHTCSNCGREFEIKFLHPVLSSVQFCPRCGTQLD